MFFWLRVTFSPIFSYLPLFPPLLCVSCFMSSPLSSSVDLYFPPPTHLSSSCLDDVDFVFLSSSEEEDGFDLHKGQRRAYLSESSPSFARSEPSGGDEPLESNNDQDEPNPTLRESVDTLSDSRVRASEEERRRICRFHRCYGKRHSRIGNVSYVVIKQRSVLIPIDPSDASSVTLVQSLPLGVDVGKFVTTDLATITRELRSKRKLSATRMVRKLSYVCTGCDKIVRLTRQTEFGSAS